MESEPLLLENDKTDQDDCDSCDINDRHQLKVHKQERRSLSIMGQSSASKNCPKRISKPLLVLWSSPSSPPVVDTCILVGGTEKTKPTLMCRKQEEALEIAFCVAIACHHMYCCWIPAVVMALKSPMAPRATKSYRMSTLISLLGILTAVTMAVSIIAAMFALKHYYYNHNHHSINLAMDHQQQQQFNTLTLTGHDDSIIMDSSASNATMTSSATHPGLYYHNGDIDDDILMEAPVIY